MTHMVVMKLQLGLKIRWNVIIESYCLQSVTLVPPTRIANNDTYNIIPKLLCKCTQM